MGRFLALLLVIALSACVKTAEEKQASFLESGKKYLEAGDHARAILQFKNAARALPADAEVHYYLGLAYLGLGSYRDAVAAFTEATGLDPTHAEAQLRLAEMMLSSRQTSLLPEAQERMELILQGSPGNSDAHFLLAAAKAHMGSREEAEDHLREALKSSPRHLNSSVALALMKLGDKDLKGAKEILTEAILQAPGEPEPVVALGHLHTLLGESEQAEAQFRRALDMDPLHGPALLGYAGVLFREGRQGEAKEAYKKLSELPDRRYRPVYGQYLMLTRDLAGAIAEFRRLADADAGDRTARTRLVAAYLTADQLPDAQGALNEALQKNSQDSEALLQRASIYLRVGDATKAEQDLISVVQFDPSSAEAHYLLGLVHRANGQVRLERREIMEALRLKPDLLQARLELANSFIQTREPKAALDLMDATPDPQKRLLPFVTTRNWSLMALGRQSEAREDLDLVLAAGAKGGTELSLQDGVLKLRSGETSAGRSTLLQVLDENPEELRALDALLESYLKSNEKALAVEKVREHAAKHPQSARVQLYFGFWLTMVGDRAGARKAFVAAVEADPNNSEARVAIARLDAAEGRMSEAKEGLLQVLSHDSRNPRVRLLLGMVEETTGNYGKAIDQYSEVVKLDETNFVALNNLSYRLASDTDRMDEALKYAQQAKELAPDDPSVDDTIGWVYYQKGLYNTALPYLERAASSLGQAAVKYHLAMTHLQLGNVDKGRVIVAEALKIDAGLPEAAAANRLLNTALRAQAQ